MSVLDLSMKVATNLANLFAPYRGQNPQNREKRVPESKTPFPPTPETGISSKKFPFLQEEKEAKWGFFDSKRLSLDSGEMAVFRLRNP